MIEVVSLLAAGTNEGRVMFSGLGSDLKLTNPAASPTDYCPSGLLGMLQTYGFLNTRKEPEGRGVSRGDGRL